MCVTVGIDVGSGAVKAVLMRTEADSDTGGELVAHASSRIRRRDIGNVIDEVFGAVIEKAGHPDVHYIASTGEGEDIPFATGHFYGMTTHARGALYLEPRARAVLDVGALHTRAVAMDTRGKVLGYKMTSQCASGSGQFLENIARYLGVAQEEVGALSLQSKDSEKVSSICAVLAETDVINMVSRGISTPNILRGIHDSMAGRFVRLLRALKIDGVVFVSGGVASDEGLIKALEDALAKAGKGRSALPQPGGGGNRVSEIVTHPLGIHCGAIGAAIWGAFRYRKIGQGGVAWKASQAS